MASLDILNILIAILVLGVLAIFSFKKRIVTKSGLFAAFFLGLGIWLLASWAWFFILLIFFLVTAQFTHYKYQKKRALGAAQDKSGARAWTNVITNGILPLGFVLIGFIIVTLGGGWDAFGRTDVGWGLVYLPFPVLGVAFAAFLGAIATHTADTLATEIGLLNPSPPRLITKPWKHVPAGTSGGVSLMGELATFMGSLLIGGVSAFLAAPFWIAIFGTTLMPELMSFAPVTMIIVALVGGFVGCTTDSIFGATIQGMWRCTVCSKKTEKKVHCQEPAEYLRGNRFFDNNAVNLVSGLLGAIAAMLLYLSLLSIGFA
ncbi:MAG: TIGR00297 family protein [Candidatus Hodarchaeota archaeon]